MANPVEIISPAGNKLSVNADGTLNALAVSGPISGATVNDKSGTVTSGGVAQTLMALNTARRGGSIQNQSTGDLWLRATSAAAATQPSFWLPAGAFVTLDELGITTELVSIYGATTSQAFAAREW